MSINEKRKNWKFSWLIHNTHKEPWSQSHSDETHAWHTSVVYFDSSVSLKSRHLSTRSYTVVTRQGDSYASVADEVTHVGVTIVATARRLFPCFAEYTHRHTGLLQLYCPEKWKVLRAETMPNKDLISIGGNCHLYYILETYLLRESLHISRLRYEIFSRNAYKQLSEKEKTDILHYVYIYILKDLLRKCVEYYYGVH